MRRWWKIVLLAICTYGVTAGLCIWVFLPPDPGPSYQGKTLYQWMGLDHLDDHSPADVEAIHLAIRSIGTNAIPTLLRWTKSTRVRFGRSATGDDFYYSYSDLAEGVFGILGPEATPAIPKLTQIINDRWTSEKVARAAARGIAAMGSNTVPVLILFVDDHKNLNRHSAVLATAIVCSDSHINKARLSSTFIRWSRDEDEKVAVAATRELGWFQTAPDVVIPSLFVCLGDKRAAVRINAIRSLTMYTNFAVKILPQIETRLTDNNATVREAATNGQRRLRGEFVAYLTEGERRETDQMISERYNRLGPISEWR